MKPVHMALIGAGALGVGFLILRSRNANASPLPANYIPPVQVQTTAADEEARQAALLRSTVGARAASGASAGLSSVLSSVMSSANALNAKGMGAIGDKVLPGSGEIFQQVGSVVGRSTTAVLNKVAPKAISAVGSAGKSAVSAIKKLKFW